MHLSRERCQSEWAAVDRCSELMGVWNLAQGHFGRAPEMSYHLSCKWPSVHYFGPQLRLEPETSLAMYRLSYCSTPKLQHWSVVKSDKLGHKRVHTRPQPSNNTSNHPSIYELIHPSIHLFIHPSIYHSIHPPPPSILVWISPIGKYFENHENTFEWRKLQVLLQAQYVSTHYQSLSKPNGENACGLFIHQTDFLQTTASCPSCTINTKTLFPPFDSKKPCHCSFHMMSFIRNIVLFLPPPPFGYCWQAILLHTFSYIRQ